MSSISLQQCCIHTIAHHINSSTFAYKKFSLLPPQLLQQLFDRVYLLWNQKCHKSQVLRILLLFTEANLISLNLSKTLAQDYILEALCQKVNGFRSGFFPLLKSLTIHVSTQTTSNKMLLNFFNLCPNLTHLEVIILDDVIVQNIFVDVDILSIFPLLETLQVNFSKPSLKRKFSQTNLLLPNAFILDLINQPLTQLTYLNLKDRLLHPTTIKSLAHRSPCLTHLILDGTEVTDSNLSSISRHCRNLKTLSLRDCKRLTDQGFNDIGRGFLSSLQHLSIANCRKLTEVTLGYVVEGCPSLVLFDLRGCNLNLVNSDVITEILTALTQVNLIVSFNDSKTLGDISTYGFKIHVFRRFFNAQTQGTDSHYYRFDNPTQTFPLPNLPLSCQSIWPSFA